VFCSAARPASAPLGFHPPAATRRAVLAALLPAACAVQMLTPAQLHLLRQQIDTLKRINVQLRALKYKARTGQELPSWRAPAVTAPAASRGGGGRSGGRGGRGRGGRGSSSLGHSGGTGPLLVVGGGRGRGRGRGSKRGRWG
jgi:hypothetical protein